MAPKLAWMAFGLGDDVRVVEQRDGGALQRLRAAAVEERPGAGHRLDDLPRADGPGGAPAGVAPVLGQAVEQDDRIAVDVLDVAGGALDGQAGPPGAGPDVVRVELVEQQRAVELARQRDPLRELVALHQLAGRVAGVRQQQRRQPAPLDLAAQIVDGEGIAALPLEQDGDGGEGLEDVEQLLVGGVVGQEVAQVDLAEAGRRARERRAPAARDADVLGAVLRRHPAPVEAVVEAGDRLAQLPDAGDRRVLLIVDVDRDALRPAAARRGAGRSRAVPGRGSTRLDRRAGSRAWPPRW